MSEVARELLRKELELLIDQAAENMTEEEFRKAVDAADTIIVEVSRRTGIEVP